MVKEFFLPMIPPTVTGQMREVSVRNGKPFFYDPPEVRDARMKLMAMLNRHAPAEPITGQAVRLTVKWLFPKGKHKDGEYRITPPDTDNLQKLFKDSMTAVGFWKDDSVVASEISEKFWAARSGIYVRIETL